MLSTGNLSSFFNKPCLQVCISYNCVYKCVISYSCVYKCVCKQFSERLYSDLLMKISSYLDHVSLGLQVSLTIPNYSSLIYKSLPFQVDYILVTSV